jgi:hypothetical protein
MLQTYNCIKSSERSEINTTMTALSNFSLKNIRDSQLFKNYSAQYKQAYFSLQQKCVRKTTIPRYKPMEAEIRDSPINSNHSDRLWWPNPFLVGGGGEGGGEGGGGGGGGEGDEE